mgnify:CR=1 FL=1|jgi:ParB-like chromosome segregation protein Spo0J
MSYDHLHEIDSNPETNQHLAEIVESIKQNGWVGLPLLADGENLFNGCHRVTACEILSIEPKVHQLEIACAWGDDEYTDYLLQNLTDAMDTQSVLNALKDLRDEGMVDQLSVDIMQAEYEKE